jgi:hypothetical protein
MTGVRLLGAGALGVGLLLDPRFAGWALWPPPEDPLSGGGGLLATTCVGGAAWVAGFRDALGFE